jgi:putative redox protein
MSNTASLALETVEGEGLRFKVKAGSGTEMTLDSGPGMVAPSPVEALLAALGGCGAMDVISILRKKRQVVVGYEVSVSGERRKEYPRAFTLIEIVHRVRGRNLNPAAIEEAIRLSDTKYCSVHASLSKDIEIRSRYEIVPA